MSALELPILDFGKTTSIDELAKQFAYAGETTGFMQIVNHGMSEELIASAFDSAKTFFELPLEDKVALRRDNHPSRGYLLIGSQVLEGSLGVEHEGAHLVDQAKMAMKSGDQKEAFSMGFNTPKDSKNYGRYAHGQNKLPTETQVPGIQKLSEDYMTEIWKLQQKLSDIVALSLGQDPSNGVNKGFCEDAIVFFRFLHYPATTKKDVTGIGAHTDFGFTTLLATSGEPGLEVYYKGDWHAVEPEKGAFIVNIGDCLSLVSGGRYKSSLHRVMNNSGLPRYSIPCFLEGNPDFVVKPVDAKEGEEYPTVMELLQGRHRSSYPDVKIPDDKK